MKTYFFWGVVKSVTLPVVLVLEGSSVPLGRAKGVKDDTIKNSYHPLACQRQGYR